MTKRLATFLIVAAFVIGAGSAYSLAAVKTYDHCLSGWHWMLDDIIDDFSQPPYDDWPGRAQCHGQTYDVLGRWGTWVLPALGPMPPIYDELRRRGRPLD